MKLKFKAGKANVRLNGREYEVRLRRKGLIFYMCIDVDGVQLLPELPFSYRKAAIRHAEEKILKEDSKWESTH